MNLPAYPKPQKPDPVKLIPVKTRARKKGPPVRKNHPEDDKRFVRYW